jgi:hypothetical protein
MRALWLGLFCATLGACKTVDHPDPGVASHGEGTATQAAQSAQDTQPAQQKKYTPEKPGAPVSVEGHLDGGTAKVDLAFDADGSDVTVEVWGTDGLVVTSTPTPVAGRAVNRGQKLSLDVFFTAPATRCDLAVRVRGTFGGKTSERVRSFSVNPNAPSPSTAPGDVRTDADGRPVRVMK